MTNNAQLKQFYEGVYKKGEKDHYTQFRLQKGDLTEEFAAVLATCDWQDKTVLDVGCGTGDICALIADAGAASVLGVDFAEDGIVEAKQKYSAPNLEFVCDNIENISGTFDVIVSIGTLEHMDNPFATLKRLKSMVSSGGSMVMTCPNWLNPRGYMLQVLWHLFRAPITLADIHYLGPVDFMEWAEQLDMDLDWQTVDCEWASGAKMVKDLERRLPNVARDADWDIPQEHIDGLLQWLQTRVVPFKDDRKHAGVAGVYHLKRRD
ncbi:MAG: class I SAM-dependent methyltransferase [Candidatus Peregrinibacteria bacterium]|nr:class I SAM-dependent methyltransferase [Candidatus Peregrinibacteria bacterium]MCB9807996.1 class I SAM-dependent methyltransferase [Candidatus Peribacteria bacterium]